MASLPLALAPHRMHEALLDREAVAARDDALLVVGIDPGMDEKRAPPGIQKVSHLARAGHRGDGVAVKAAGRRGRREIDAGAGRARLHAGGAVVAVVETHD